MESSCVCELWKKSPGLKSGEISRRRAEPDILTNAAKLISWTNRLCVAAMRVLAERWGTFSVRVGSGMTVAWEGEGGGGLTQGQGVV